VFYGGSLGSETPGVCFGGTPFFGPWPAEERRSRGVGEQSAARASQLGAALCGSVQTGAAAVQRGSDQARTRQTRPVQFSSVQCSAARHADSAGQDRTRSRSRSRRLGSEQHGSSTERGRNSTAQDENADGAVQFGTEQREIGMERRRRGMARLEHGAELERRAKRARHSARQRRSDRWQLGSRPRRIERQPARRGTVDAAEPRPDSFHEPFCRVAFVQKICID
jgi:hypothetical protein